MEREGEGRESERASEREREREREGKGEGERDRDTDLLFHLFMRSSVASSLYPTEDGTCNLGMLGRCANQLSYSANTWKEFLNKTE